MNETRVFDDAADPCGACGAPWRKVEVGIEVGGQIVRWVRGSGGGCTAECFAEDLDAYNAELQRRANRPQG